MPSTFKCDIIARASQNTELIETACPPDHCWKNCTNQPVYCTTKGCRASLTANQKNLQRFRIMIPIRARQCLGATKSNKNTGKKHTSLRVSQTDQANHPNAQHRFSEVRAHRTWRQPSHSSHWLPVQVAPVRTPASAQTPVVIDMN